MRAARRASLLLLAVSAGGCSVVSEFRCERHAQCSRDGVAGLCVDGWCVQPDGTCDGGYSYVPESPMPGVCVMGDPTDADPGPIEACVARVAAGDRHTCAANVDGQVYCWGDNQSLQLGSTGAGGAAPTLVPLEIGPVVALAAGLDNTCVLDDAGALTCWGANQFNQLGFGSTSSQGGPGRVELPGPVSRIALGARHACALVDDTSPPLQCWGDNRADQVSAMNDEEVVLEPDSPFISTPTIVALAAGESHSAAITTNVIEEEFVETWGLAGSPALGRGADAPPGPGEIDQGSFLPAQLAAGAEHTCGIDQDLRLLCWGNGESGQLGVEGTQAQPVEVTATGRVTVVRAGARHTCAIDEEEKLVCFGDNREGQLGDEEPGGPALHAIAGPWSEAALGQRHTCAIDRGGALYCWGANEAGQLGTAGPDRAEPRQVAVPCDGDEG